MLWLYLESIAYGLLHPEQLRGLQAVISSLADPALRQQAQRQLEQLCGGGGGGGGGGEQRQQGRRLTLSQLLRCCHFHIIRQAPAMDKSPLELPALREAAGVSGLAVSQLDPTNPKSHAAEADADRLVGGSRPGQASSNVERHLRAWRLAQQQRSDYWVAYSAAGVLLEATFAPAEVGPGGLEAALAAFEQTAEAGLRRCKRLLPEEWVSLLARRMEIVATLVPGAHEQLRLLHQLATSRNASSNASSSGSPAAHAALKLSVFAQRHAAREQAGSIGWQRFELGQSTKCDGCGEPAVGLRRCSRCTRAQYCRCGTRHVAVQLRSYMWLGCGAAGIGILALL